MSLVQTEYLQVPVPYYTELIRVIIPKAEEFDMRRFRDLYPGAKVLVILNDTGYVGIYGDDLKNLEIEMNYEKAMIIGLGTLVEPVGERWFVSWRHFFPKPILAK